VAVRAQELEVRETVIGSVAVDVVRFTAFPQASEENPNRAMHSRFEEPFSIAACTRAQSYRRANFSIAGIPKRRAWYATVDFSRPSSLAIAT
jgi:hypothetical protein